MKDYTNKENNPYADDPVAREAVEILVEFMRRKVNPDFTENDAWEFYIQVRPLNEADGEEIEGRVPNGV